ncbi:hypothetical protein FA95DRAFT_1559086 [Auriscalpium vulgare]|uniref:Uncharacterized protein n=1 Tax=Auriscalpium vulgare TaxID=40419 RepID=A0ACB8RV17_9AGAM|nr:hypothetical protein FA95DRAFT_1559086 [Auriscalpium vulgare]
MHSVAIDEQHKFLAHINKLPPEVFGRIFLLCQDVDSPFEHDDIVGPSLGWIRVTHVCRHWRAVALEMRDLWTRIPFSLGTHWVDTMFARAERTPLVVNCTTGPCLTEHQQEQIVTHLSHIKVLRIVGDADEISTVAAALDTPTPCLELLEVCATHAGPPVVLPELLLGASAPRLRSLSVGNPRSFPWSSPVLRDLTSLFVHIVPRSAPMAYWRTVPSTTFTDFLSALEGIKGLRTLSLTGCCPWRSSAGSEHRVIRLSRLEQLTFSSALRDCTTILSHLDVPSNARLSVLSLSAGIRGTDGLLAFFSALKTYLHIGVGADPQHISYLEVIRDLPETLSVSLSWPSATSVTSPPVQMRFQGPGMFYDRERRAYLDFVRIACDTLASAQLRTLKLHEPCPDLIWSAVRWKGHLAPAGAVRELATSHDGVAMLVEALTPSRGASDDLLLPTLESLEFADTDLHEIYEDDETGEVDSVFDMLVTCLELRSLNLASTSKRCAVNRLMIDRLKCLTLTVEWRGSHGELYIMWRRSPARPHLV